MENRENQENIVQSASSGATTQLSQSKSPSYTLPSLTSYSRETPTDQNLDVLSPSESGTRCAVETLGSSELQQQPSSSKSSSDKAPDTPALSPKSLKTVDFMPAPSTSSQAKLIVRVKPNLSLLMSRFRDALQPKELTSPQSQHSSPISEGIELQSIDNVVGLSDEETTCDFDRPNVPLLDAGLQSENNELVSANFQGTRCAVKTLASSELQQQPSSSKTSSDKAPDTPALPPKSLKIVDFTPAPSTSSKAKGIARVKPNLSLLMSRFRDALQPKELTSLQSQHSSPISEGIELQSIDNVVGLSDEETTCDLDRSNVPLLDAGLQSENSELVSANFQGIRCAVKTLASSELQQQPSSSKSSSDKAPDTPALSPKSLEIVDFIPAPSTSSQAKGIAKVKPNLSLLMSRFRNALQLKELTPPQSQLSSPINEEIELQSMSNVVGLSDEETTGDLDRSNVPILNAGLQYENNELVNRASALDARSQDQSPITSSGNTAGTMSTLTEERTRREECGINRKCVYGCAVGYVGGAITILLILAIVYFVSTVKEVIAKKSSESCNGTVSANSTTLLPTFDPNATNFSGKHDDRLSNVTLPETQIATTNGPITTISNNTSIDDAPKSKIVSTTETSIGKSKRKRNVGN